jgi:hypothetical protein
MTALPEIEPMYSEAHAAKLCGIKPRSLRTEREAGRIRFKRVAGKTMYRHSDLLAWQQEGETCRDKEEDRDLSPSRNGVGKEPCGISDGQSTAGRASVRQAKRTASALKRRSPTGSSNNVTVSDTAGQVVQIRS